MNDTATAPTTTAPALPDAICDATALHDLIDYATRIGDEFDSEGRAELAAIIRRLARRPARPALTAADAAGEARGRAAASRDLSRVMDRLRRHANDVAGAAEGAIAETEWANGMSYAVGELNDQLAAWLAAALTEGGAS